MTRFTPSPSRREFIRNLLRGTILAALAGTAGLTLRGRPLVWSAPPCRASGSCDSCRLFAGCGLPQAASTRATPPAS